MLRDRMAGDGGAVYGSANLAFVWNRDTQQVERGTIDYSASRSYQIGRYLKNEFAVPKWTRIVVVCAIDGKQSAAVTVDPSGLPESDYLAGFDDPIFQHLDEHRAELEALAHRHYGSSG